MISKLPVTLALIKPSAVSRPHVVEGIVECIRKEGLYIIRRKGLQLTRDRALQFYQEHHGRFFYNRLVTYMSSGPMVAMVLTGDNAIKRWRQLMGPTKVYRTQYEAPNTIRGLYGISDTRNATHGSDSEESARKELQYFFPEFDIDQWYAREEACFRTKRNVFYNEKLGIHVHQES